MNILKLIVASFIVLICAHCTPKEAINPIFEGDIELSSTNKNLKDVLNTLKDKEIINGTLYIGDIDVQSLDVLKTIKTIKSNLIISNALVSDLRFLSSLENVSGDTKIFANKNLSTVAGLEKLQFTQELYISGGYKVLILDAIQNINVAKSLTLGAINVEAFAVFKNITTIDGSIFIQNNAIKDLNCFPNLTTVTKSFYIIVNDSLKRINGLNQLLKVGDGLTIFSKSLEKLDGLKNLTTVGNSFLISSPVLNSLSDLSKLASVLSFHVSGTNCENLIGLENLTNAQYINIRANQKLSNFCALKPLLLKSNNINYIVVDNLINPTKADIIANCN